MRISDWSSDVCSSDLPPGTVVRETPLGVRDDYTSLAWLAGQLAFKDLGRPAEAEKHYRAYGEAARSAQTRTKGFYWAGRAALAAGDRAGAIGRASCRERGCPYV